MNTTYRTAGTTDEITTCDLCGRIELAGTVRLELVTDTGVIEGEVYAGTTCASKAAGRTAAAIKREARDADTANREAEHRAEYDRQQTWLDAHGLERNYRNIKAYRADAA